MHFSVMGAVFTLDDLSGLHLSKQAGHNTNRIDKSTAFTSLVNVPCEM